MALIGHGDRLPELPPLEDDSDVDAVRAVLAQALADIRDNRHRDAARQLARLWPQCAAARALLGYVSADGDSGWQTAAPECADALRELVEQHSDTEFSGWALRLAHTMMFAHLNVADGLASSAVLGATLPPELVGGFRGPTIDGLQHETPTSSQWSSVLFANRRHIRYAANIDRRGAAVSVAAAVIGGEMFDMVECMRLPETHPKACPAVALAVFVGAACASRTTVTPVICDEVVAVLAQQFAARASLTPRWSPMVLPHVII